MKQLFKVFMATALIIFASCQKNDLNEPGKTETGTAILTASIGDMTKVGFEDQNTSGLKVTWSAGDKIGLYDESSNYACVFVLKTGEEGKAKAEFEKESGTFDASKTYTVVYPYIENMADLAAYAAEKATRLAADQTQDGATLDHLAGLCFIEGTNNQNSITFDHTISILTLELEKPAAAGATEMLTTIGFTNDSKNYTLNITNGSWTNKAYMVIDPIATQSRDLSFDVTTDTGNLFNFNVQTSKEYKAGERYTAKLTSGTLNKTTSMKFTVDTRKNNATDATFIVPFPATKISGYGLTILWGDGQKSYFADGADLTQANLTHTYAAASKYQITIRSTEANSANQQMPAMNFSDNYGPLNSNNQKLISMDTPMLNTAATSFNSVFSRCSSLTTIPTRLFDKNTNVMDFANCFASCTNLAIIPDGLFAKNTKATEFIATFRDCVKLQLHSNIFCNEANNEHLTRFQGQSVQFIDCFRRNSFTGIQGTAPALWTYSGSFITIGCFGDWGNTSSSLSNYTSIPQEWIIL